jgi:hypothetical protein
MKVGQDGGVAILAALMATSVAELALAARGEMIVGRHSHFGLFSGDC